VTKDQGEIDFVKRYRVEMLMLMMLTMMMFMMGCE